MVELPNGETIFHRQLRLLHACGIREYVVTTGPFSEQIEQVSSEFECKGCSFRFVRNRAYDETNYIYSMWLAREELLGDDVLMLHGDLVFDAAYVEGLLALPGGSYGSVDPTLPLPEKDFKARVVGGEVREVGVGTWGEGCVAFQAMYRLAPEAMRAWLGRVDDFVRRGDTGVYAEDAANEVFGRMRVQAHAYTGHVLEEVDTPEDLERVGSMIRMSDFASQPVLSLGENGVSVVGGRPAGRVAAASDAPSLMDALGIRRPLVVADGFLGRDGIVEVLGTGEFEAFSGYAPNPTYEQVLSAVMAYRSSGCDSIVSLGGGSAIDVAKCVKLWAGLPGDGSGSDSKNRRFCEREACYSAMPHLAIPTTAGTGSESTHFAVVYVDGAKTSVAHDCMHPDAALLVPGLLAGLPAYQRKATMLDALCQAIESYWSVNSCEESREYSRRAIPEIVRVARRYVCGDPSTYREMALAANLAGKAINLTTTTLPHAMSYKLTSLYGIAHGHAVALCMPFAWRMLMERGDEMTQSRLSELSELMTGDVASSPVEGLGVFEALYGALGLQAPVITEEDLDVLSTSVNPQRLANYPIKLSKDELREAYRAIR